MDMLWIVLVGAVVAVTASIALLRHFQRAEREKRKSFLDQKNAIFHKFSRDFERVGWGRWGYDVHIMPDQRDRMGRAIYSKKMKLLEYDPDCHTARVLGEQGGEYLIDERGCSCPDFQKRLLPCKHMYFAAMEISCEDDS